MAVSENFSLARAPPLNEVELRSSGARIGLAGALGKARAVLRYLFSIGTCRVQA